MKAKLIPPRERHRCSSTIEYLDGQKVVIWRCEQCCYERRFYPGSVRRSEVIEGPDPTVAHYGDNMDLFHNASNN